MSFTVKKREQIKHYILEKIDNRQKNIAKRTADAYQISLNTVYRYLRELENDNIIFKENGQYHLAAADKLIHLTRSEETFPGEDLIYMNYVNQYIEHFPDNIKNIWQYSFTEMMNNAIEHSKADHIDIYVTQNYMNTMILIRDDGIGIFRKIREYYRYPSLDDAVHELFKGKLTTDSLHHSGEGIFFTSRILDRFAAISDGKVFSHDKLFETVQNLEESGISEKWEAMSGTIIYMELSNFSQKKTKEVFDMFSDVDGGFTRTRIPIKNLYDTFPVSRSQARRLCNRFEKFQEIELDFEEIEEIGQGFAHELFCVFQNEHPNIRLIPLHASPDIEKMIRHVTRS